MKTATAALLAATLILSGCGGFRDSRLNPLNWFGRSTEGPATLEPAEGYAAVSGDFRVPVREIVSLEVQQVPGGALVTAEGLPATQGWWDAELVAEDNGKPVDGVLTLRFLAAEPRAATPASTAQSRELTAGIFLSDQALEGVRQIVVAGEVNSRSSRR
ncbi:hypothetical protein [Ostreiculturibacter nitratireducens]|uniref:hypothetical protein n=1 Tax=Ostreiculturibacter nitratireducens TaxID=3075226 RepID=UPI0031B5FF5F